MAIENVQRPYMFLKDVHICSNKFDEEAHRAHMFFERAHICSNKFDDKVKRTHSRKDNTKKANDFWIEVLAYPEKEMKEVRPVGRKKAKKKASASNVPSASSAASIKRNKQHIVDASSTPQVMVIQGKGKGLQNSYPIKPKKPQPYKKEHPTKDGQCHHCKEEGHWKRNCPVYLAELMKKKKKTGGQNVSSTSSERRNRTLLNMDRSMMSLATLPLSFWDYALEFAARILNMVPTKKVDKTPYELWHGKVPNLCYLKETMGYYFYYPPENKIVVERYAYFLEKDFIPQKESGRIMELENEDILLSKNTSEHPIEEENLAPIVSQEEDVIPVRRSVRTHKAPDRLCLNVEIDPDRLCFNVEVEEHSLGYLNEPANYKAVLSDPEFEKWLSKWIYKKKMNMDGKVHIYKARLVAKGCTQTYGVDYEETFSPVADIKAIRILIAIAAYYDYEIWQMDVKTAFLNGFLEEEIYMEQPEGFIDPNHPMKASGSNVIFLILYVDDIILMGNHIPSLQEVKTYLGKCFSMKDLGEATFILGIKIYRDRSRRLIRLSQNAYLDKILKRYRMDKSKCGSIPMQVDLHLSKSQCATTSAEMKRMQNVPYASAVGSIMYVVRCTRPDVAFAQNITSRFQQNSGEAHWTDVKNILKYLRNTKDTFLVYGGDPEAELRVNYYCDAGFETDSDVTKSQTGYVFVLNGGAVVWKSSKQSTTA
nr:hypothetical protein [Tanacetum cinerariifolium]